MVDNTSIVARLEIAIEEVEQNPNQFYVRTPFLREVLTALKMQEPVLAVKLQSKKYIGRTGIAYDGSCGNCHTYLMRAWRACPICGKLVKWE
jgi:hypothetical protein